MKIFSSSQIRKADAYTIAHEPVTELKLMERAAEACAKWLEDKIPRETVFYIFCGSGNNGGDGLALARLLCHNGLSTHVFVDESNEQGSEARSVNFQRLAEHPEITVYQLEEALGFAFEANSVLVDALFGTGLNREIDGKYAELFKFLNELPLRRISIDLPSGLFADRLIKENATVFAAHDTLSFQFWKQSFLHPETGTFCGNVHILDIGLHKNFIGSEPSNQFVADDKVIFELYKPRSPFTHKGKLGKTRIIAGSYGKMGAAVLAVQAAVHCGSGLTVIEAPECGNEILQTSCPEAMFELNGDQYATAFLINENESVGVGPGLGTNPDTAKAFLKFLQDCTQPMVIDADALNIIASNPDSLKMIPKDSILTPHPKEFERLFGSTANSYERVDLAQKMAAELGVTIVLKDHFTQICLPDGSVYYNTTGNAGMAKGGSGDVLLGIITSLLAQKYEPAHAAIFGVWLHGKAGDFAMQKSSVEAMLPTDLISELGSVFKCLSEKKGQIH
ncbi:NAD(P)H-hydrate dehydratase [Kaistella rhinocerotis]|uniref:NAD(P)H-hydrate dehydratase n=1 Tax=Kaistella rhinocerotis TaxID=3026437 RepID=UPI00255735CC|nr:NAD(P)H-hydrate dehydratase [Kaistella sp. Ran72]